jgi:hypothetical protein
MDNSKNLNYSIMDVADASEESMMLDYSIETKDVDVFF